MSRPPWTDQLQKNGDPYEYLHKINRFYGYSLLYGTCHGYQTHR